MSLSQCPVLIVIGRTELWCAWIIDRNNPDKSRDIVVIANYEIPHEDKIWFRSLAHLHFLIANDSLTLTQQISLPLIFFLFLLKQAEEPGMRCDLWVLYSSITTWPKTSPFLQRCVWIGHFGTFRDISWQFGRLSVEFGACRLFSYSCPTISSHNSLIEKNELRRTNGRTDPLIEMRGRI